MDIQKPTPAPTSIRKFILRWCSASSTVRTAMRSYFSAVKLTNNMCPSSDSMTLTSQSADPQTLSREVSLSIALHTTPTIAKRAGTLPYLIRTAVLLDFSDDKRMEFNLQCLQNELETQLPRLEIERVLANAVVRESFTQGSKGILVATATGHTHKGS